MTYTYLERSPLSSPKKYILQRGEEVHFTNERSGQTWSLTLEYGFRLVENTEPSAISISLHEGDYFEVRYKEIPTVSWIYLYHGGAFRELKTSVTHETYGTEFGAEVDRWMSTCFGEAIKNDRLERNYRFYEEATELVQGNGLTREQAHAMVDAVFDRPMGDPKQEVGGVEVTLTALCNELGVDRFKVGIEELDRIWSNINKIREKNKAKPLRSSQ